MSPVSLVLLSHMSYEQRHLFYLMLSKSYLKSETASITKIAYHGKNQQLIRPTADQLAMQIRKLDPGL